MTRYAQSADLTAEDTWVIADAPYGAYGPIERRMRAVGSFTATVSIQTKYRDETVWQDDGTPDQSRPFDIIKEISPDMDIRCGVKTGNFTAVSDTIGSGDGSTTTFTGTLTGLPIIPGSLTVTAGSVTGTDDGSGNISGTGVSGTIDYTSGAISVTYTTAPASGTSVTASHRNGPVRVSIS